MSPKKRCKCGSSYREKDSRENYRENYRERCHCRKRRRDPRGCHGNCGSPPCCRKLTIKICRIQQTTNQNTTAIAVSQQPYITSPNYSNNFPVAGNSIENLYRAVAAAGSLPPITPGRTITFHNGTAGTDLDLYLTVGGTNPQPIKMLATITTVGPDYVWPIPDDIYGWSGNFTTMPAGIPPPQFNAGPTNAEFGLNQYWHGATPDMRDTFDISTVPPGIGSSVDNGPRSAAVAASRAAGFTIQQSFNYNVGVEIVSSVVGGVLPTVTVTCTVTNGDSPDSIGYPNDTAVPKQQTGVATGDYTINFLDPVVSLP